MLELIPWRAVKKWRCVHCGYCCKEYDVPLSFEEEERLKVYGDVFTRGKLGVYLKKDGTCVFRKNGKCAIYEIRPKACEKYPFFFREKGEKDAEFEFQGKKIFVYVDKNCKGIGKGEDVRREIEKILRKILLIV